VSVWHFIVALIVLAVWTLLRIGAQSGAAWDAGGRMPLPTARQRRVWRRERLDLNPAMRRRRS